LNLLIAALVLVSVLWGVKLFANANPAVLARNLRKAGGCVIIAGAGFLALRGLLQLAVPLAVFGASLLFNLQSWTMPWGSSGGGGGGGGRASVIRTDTLEMSLDHATGALSGKVLKGRFAQRPIESLSPAEIAALWQECRWTDPQAAQLLEAFLDRTHPDWREHMSADGAGAGSSSSASPQSLAGQMSREEAFRILGLEPGADSEEVRRAHRELMMKLHPDRGGSTYLAAKINEAKAVLLGK